MAAVETCPAGCNKGLHEWVHLRLSKHGLQHADVFYCKWCLKYEKKVV